MNCRICKIYRIEVDETMGKGKLIDEIFGEKVKETSFSRLSLPIIRSKCLPLKKNTETGKVLLNVFELMVCGKEIANAYSELNDPIGSKRTFRVSNGAF